MSAPDLDRVRFLLNYDPETGLFTWKHPTNRRIKAGSVAGCIDGDGYVVIRLDGVLHKAHRLAIYLAYVEWPEYDVDHRDGVRDNNAILNLRPASRMVNMQNLKRARKDNRSGVLGVTVFGNRFRASIKVAKKQKHLGCFGSADEAHQVYLAAKRVLHEGCTI